MNWGFFFHIIQEKESERMEEEDNDTIVQQRCIDIFLSIAVVATFIGLVACSAILISHGTGHTLESSVHSAALTLRRRVEEIHSSGVARTTTPTVLGARWTCATECLCSGGGLSYYGRYCGFGHSGCPGIEPCDAWDTCCKLHDECVTSDGKMDPNCTCSLIRCGACVYTDMLSNNGRSRSTWQCDKTMQAIEITIADLTVLLPGCLASI